jgi:hypothetical protein
LPQTPHSIVQSCQSVGRPRSRQWSQPLTGSSSEVVGEGAAEAGGGLLVAPELRERLATAVEARDAAVLAELTTDPATPPELRAALRVGADGASPRLDDAQAALDAAERAAAAEARSLGTQAQVAAQQAFAFSVTRMYDVHRQRAESAFHRTPWSCEPSGTFTSPLGQSSGRSTAMARWVKTR